MVPTKSFPGGPAAVQRLDRDVLALSGITGLIWLEGINDFSKNGNASVEQVIAAMKDGVARLRAKWPHIRVIGATVTSALGSSSGAHGFPEQDAKRKALNDFIRTSGTFDGVADFDKAALDPQSGGLKPEFVPESTTGGPGDKLHPNRTGYLAMGQSIDLDLFKPGNASKTRARSSLAGDPDRTSCCQPNAAANDPGIFGHSNLMLAARTTLAHCSVSSAMSSRYFAGDSVRTVAPRSASRARIFWSPMISFTVALSLSMISTGVAFGAPSPNTASTS